MRVAFIVEKFPNVSETFILDEIVGILRRGIEVDIYAFRRGGEADVHPAYTAFRLKERTIYCVPAIRGRVARLVASLPASMRMLVRNPRAFFKSALTRKQGIRSRTFFSLARAFTNSGRNYDVVHAHFGPNGIRADVLRRVRALRAPLVTTFHGYDVTSFVALNGTAVYHDLALHGERFIAVSRSVAGALLDIGLPAERTEIMPLGVDCREFPPRADDDGSRPIRIVSVGRFVEKKGFEYGIRAVAQAHRLVPRLAYDIIGDGDLRPALESLVAELGAADFVTFHGYKNQTEVGVLLARGDIMLVPSVTAASGDQEGLPVVVKEAMACGLPVVASRHAGIPEIVDAGVTGFLAEERDTATLAQHLVSLATDASARRTLGAAGRSVIESEFDNERLIDALVTLYRDLASGDLQMIASRHQGITRRSRLESMSHEADRSASCASASEGIEIGAHMTVLRGERTTTPNPEPKIYHVLQEAEVFSEHDGGATSRWVANVLRDDSTARVVCARADRSWGFSPASVMKLPALALYARLMQLTRGHLPWRWRRRICMLVFARFCSSLQPDDIVYIHNRPELVAVFRRLLGTRRTRVFLHLHNSHLVTYPRPIITAATADMTVFCSRFLAEEAIAQFPGLRPTAVVANGADPALFFPPARNEHRTTSPIPVVLFVGRLVPEKGAHVFVDALTLLAQRGIEIRGRIVGSAEFGSDAATPYTRQLRAAATANIEFLPYASGTALAEEFRRATIFCCPSVWNEAFGMVNVEAMATGLPVVATDVGGIADIFSSGGALLVPPNSASELADAIEKVATDAALRTRLADEAYRAFRQRYVWDVIRTSYRAVVSEQFAQIS